MQKNTFFKIFMLGMMLVSFTVVGCESDAEEAAEGEDTPAENVSAEEASGDAGDMKAAMLEMTREMYDIVQDVESIEDVEEADEEIGEIFDEMVENMRGAMKDPSAMMAMEQEMQNDPEMKEWSEKMDAAMNKMKEEKPEVAAALEASIQKHAMKLMTLVGEAMQNLDPAAMEEAGKAMEEAAKEAMEDVNAGE